MKPIMTFSYKLDGINNTYKVKNSLSELGYYHTRYKIRIFEKKELKRNLCKICEENLLENLYAKNCKNCEKVVQLILLIKSKT